MYFFSSSHIGEHCTGTIFTSVADGQCFDAGPDMTLKFFIAIRVWTAEQQCFLSIFKEMLTITKRTTVYVIMSDPF